MIDLTKEKKVIDLTKDEKKKRTVIELSDDEDKPAPKAKAKAAPNLRKIKKQVE